MIKIYKILSGKALYFNRGMKTKIRLFKNKIFE
jgi:hypothetical protein